MLIYTFKTLPSESPDSINHHSTAANMSDCVPPELVTGEILFRLPVISLLRFRSVCKQWRTLIDSPEFIKRQITHSSTTTRNATLFLLDDALFSVPFSAGLRRQPYIPPPSQFPYHFTKDATLFGSCHGLLCIRYLSTERIHILNPATRKLHFTGSVFPAGYSSSELDTGYGCGYDSVSDDYKVVRICRLGTKRESEVISFGIRSKICQVVQMPYTVASSEQKLGVFVGGSLNWIVSKNEQLWNRKPIIVGYDLAMNRCREVPVPEFGEENVPYFLAIGEMRNCLCVFANHLGKVVHVWIMKEYGEIRSWSKLFSVPNPGLYYARKLVALGLSMSGDDVLLQLDGKRLVWCDIQGKKGCGQETVIRGWGRSRDFDCIVCLESLVSPPETETVEEDDNDEHHHENYECDCGFETSDEDDYSRYTVDYFSL
ncbi:F-box protein CPR1 [Linum grandiflorum]